jgi:hypothetical protein
VGGIIPLRRATSSRYDGRLRQESAIMFDPTRTRADLLMLSLMRGDHLALLVEKHAARARGPLIEGDDIFRHDGLS